MNYNKSHLEKLLRSIDEWNDWRKQNPDQVPNLQKADLWGADLANARLFGANLRGAKVPSIVC